VLNGEINGIYRALEDGAISAAVDLRLNGRFEGESGPTDGIIIHIVTVEEEYEIQKFLHQQLDATELQCARICRAVEIRGCTERGEHARK
jgi:hypothetical protein